MKHTKFQNFNPEQVLAVGYTKSKFITDVMMWFDKFGCKCSDLVITVSRDLVETVKNCFKGKKVPKTVMINNWIDETEIYPLDENNEQVLALKKKYGLDGKFVIMYSGNIGLYYDLENLIKVVENQAWYQDSRWSRSCVCFCRCWLCSGQAGAACKAASHGQCGFYSVLG